MNKLKKILVTAGSFVLCAVTIFTLFKFSPFPAFNRFKRHEYSRSFYDRNNELLQVTSVDGGIRREYTPLKNIPDELVKAALKAEDENFYFHSGLDLFAVVRAFFQNLTNRRRVSGASTISMQLARMISPSPERNFTAKIKDTLNAFRLEARLSKKQILELYMNNLPFGNNVEGFTSAAKYFFDKELTELNLAEIYCLAVIPRRPGLYNPAINPEENGNAAWKLYKESRKKIEWNEDAFLLAAELAEEKKWPFHFPHLVNEILKEEKNTKIKLTVDLQIQKFAEFELKSALENIKGARINNAALLLIENSSGNVLAWVGSNDWFDEEYSGQIDGVKVPNQMGSSMKPFLYAMAMDEGLIKPNTILPDIPLEFGSDKIYFPLNFNNRFNGPVRSRMALASSLNVPAVYLLDKIGVEPYYHKLLDLGFNSLLNDGLRADLGLALGAGEVTLEELTNAFSVFANDGIYKPLVLKINSDEKNLAVKENEIEYDEDYYADDDILDQVEKLLPGQKRIYSRNTARIIADILSDKSARVSGFGFTQTFETKYPSMFKTGTANQYQNIVALGSTPSYTIGVWMGNFNGNTVVGKTGSSLPAYVAKKVLDFVTEHNFEEFKKPVGYVREKICSLSGMKAGENCPNTIWEYIPEKDVDENKFDECSWHHRNEDGKTITIYPAEFQKWFSSENFAGTLDYNSSPLKILSPKDGGIFYKYESGNGQEEKIQVEVIGGLDVNEKVLKVFYDDEEFTVERPFSFEIPVELGRHNLTVQFGQESESIKFIVE